MDPLWPRKGGCFPKASAEVPGSTCYGDDLQVINISMIVISFISRNDGGGCVGSLLNDGISSQLTNIKSFNAKEIMHWALATSSRGNGMRGSCSNDS